MRLPIVHRLAYPAILDPSTSKRSIVLELNLHNAKYGAGLWLTPANVGTLIDDLSNQKSLM